MSTRVEGVLATNTKILVISFLSGQPEAKT